MNYYNDNDKNSAAWLRNAIQAGIIPPGEVDERDICDAIVPQLAAEFIRSFMEVCNQAA